MRLVPCITNRIPLSSGVAIDAEHSCSDVDPAPSRLPRSLRITVCSCVFVICVHLSAMVDKGLEKKGNRLRGETMSEILEAECSALPLRTRCRVRMNHSVFSAWKAKEAQSSMVIHSNRKKLFVAAVQMKLLGLDLLDGYLIPRKCRVNRGVKRDLRTTKPYRCQIPALPMS